MSYRAEQSKIRLRELLDAAPERRHRLLDDWLEVATSGEVRKAWPRIGRIMNNSIPPWARKTDRE